MVSSKLDDFELLIRRVSATFVGAGCDARGADRDDYANEIRLKVWQSLDDCCANAAYAHRVVWNCARDLARRSRREATMLAKVEPMLPSPFPDLDRVVAFRTVWFQTPPADKELVVRRLDGALFKDLAVENSVSDWTVRARYRQAVRPLVDALPA